MGNGWIDGQAFPTRLLPVQEHGEVSKPGYVYMMSSQRNGTIYIGATSDLAKRAWQHRNGVVPGFTKEHGCTRLVWFEACDDIQVARQREVQMKKWKRVWKLREIEGPNPEWRDLFDTLTPS